MAIRQEHFEQLQKQIIKNEILSMGQYESERLPSLRKLSEKYGFNRTDINAVLQSLERSGILDIPDRSRSLILSREKARYFLVKGRSIGVVVPTILSFYDEILSCLNESFKDNSCAIVPVVSGWHNGDLGATVKKYMDIFNFDALIIAAPNVPLSTGLKAYLQELLQQDKQIVTLNTEWDDLPGVAADQSTGIRLAVEYCLVRGRKKFVWVTQLQHSEGHDIRIRKNAFVDVLSENGIFAFLELNCDPWKADGWEKRLDEALNKHMPDAFVCVNDHAAFFLTQHLRSKGYRIPEEMNITGFDALERYQNVSLPLTSVDVMKNKLVAATAEMALKMFAGEEVKNEKNILIKPELCKGST